MHAVTTTEVFLLAMLIIFTLPYLVWRLGRTEYYAPLVVVQIVAGILLGPGVLGATFPDYYSFVFRPEVVTALNGVAWWAVMMFVWVAGIELDLDEAWKRRRETGVTADDHETHQRRHSLPPVRPSTASDALRRAAIPGHVTPSGRTYEPPRV